MRSLIDAMLETESEYELSENKELHADIIREITNEIQLNINRFEFGIIVKFVINYVLCIVSLFSSVAEHCSRKAGVVCSIHTGGKFIFPNLFLSSL